MTDIHPQKNSNTHTHIPPAHRKEFVVSVMLTVTLLVKRNEFMYAMGSNVRPRNTNSQTRIDCYKVGGNRLQHSLDLPPYVKDKGGFEVRLEDQGDEDSKTGTDYLTRSTL